MVNSLYSATAILTSLTITAPFNGTSDSNTAVAYLSIILLVFSVRLHDRLRSSYHQCFARLHSSHLGDIE